MLYADLMLSGKLYSYFAEIDAQDQMAWVGAMNNIHSCAEELILKELIYEEVSA